jgi:hypothetical protein
MLGNTYVCIYACMHLCMYIRTYVRMYTYRMWSVGMYVHTCYVLIKPTMPYITSSRCKRLHKFRPVEILLHEKGYPRVPPCNVLKNVFFFLSNHFIFLRPVKTLLHERGYPRVPPCKPLKQCGFKIYDIRMYMYICMYVYTYRYICMYV